MADIDTVLERLVSDPAFRGQLGSDPAAALAGYDLTADDLELLASSLDDTDSGQRGVEQRTSKSAVLGLLASLTGGGGGAGELQDRPPRLDGASKDTAYFGDAAPGGESEANVYMKFDDIKGESKATDGAPDDATEARLPGKPKPGEITLTRAAGGDTAGVPAGPGEQLAPVDPDGDDATYAFKQGFPIKWQGANAAPDDADAPPLGTDEPDLAFKQGFPIKWEGTNAPSDSDAPPAAGNESGDDAAAWPKKIEYSGLKAGDIDGDGQSDLGGGPTAPGTAPGTKPDDFLTIEDA